MARKRLSGEVSLYGLMNVPSFQGRGTNIRNNYHRSLRGDSVCCRRLRSATRPLFHCHSHGGTGRGITSSAAVEGVVGSLPCAWVNAMPLQNFQQRKIENGSTALEKIFEAGNRGCVFHQFFSVSSMLRGKDNTRFPKMQILEAAGRVFPF